MNTKDFIRLGVPLGEATRRATDFISRFILAGGDKTRLEEEVKAIIANPSAFTGDSLRGELARAVLNAPPPPRAEPVKYRQWGEGLEHEAVMQMERACLLPVAVAGALMPDAHVGYGLPIGGVLATLAMEHALIALLPLLAMCDRWDIGGLSIAVHHQTELPTIFVYDGHPGGVGISRQGFARFDRWLRDARALVRDCPCESGCPSCIQSPKCGNLNEPLDKEMALTLLNAVLA